MGMMTAFKANKAYRLQRKGETEEAIRLYEECFQEGLNDARYNLAYALLIIRKGEYQKAKDFLVAHQKTPGMTPDQRTTLLVDYAACCFRLGDVDKGIHTLEQQFRKGDNGLLYQTLGYLYVEKYDAARRPDFAALAAEAERAALAAAEEAEEAEDAYSGAEDAYSGAEEAYSGTAEAAETAQPAEGTGEEAAAEKPLSPEEEWEAGIAKTEAFLTKAIDYDDEDPICLDNMGQFLYRVKQDPAAAREWFEKAYARKDTQIDTLYFLSRYDLADGKKDAALEKLEKAAGGRFSPLNYCGREQISGEIARLKGE